MNKTRKNRYTNKNNIHLIELAKNKPSRLSHVKTYISNCKKGDLTFIKTIDRKPDYDEYEALQLVLGTFQKYNKPVIIKVYDFYSVFLHIEIKIYSKLQKEGFSNIITPICVFTCNDIQDKYSKDINAITVPCNKNSTKLFQFIVFDYLPYGNISNFLQINNITKNKRRIVKSIILQYILCVMDLCFNHNISHGDLNSGNILINKTTKTDAVFNILGNTFYVKLFGFEPILIDFGRSTIKHNYELDDVLFEINITFSSIIKEFAPLEYKEFVNDFFIYLSTNTPLYEYIEKIVDLIDFIYSHPKY